MEDNGNGVMWRIITGIKDSKAPSAISVDLSPSTRVKWMYTIATATITTTGAAIYRPFVPTAIG